jgi:hypothetical protein
MCAASANAPVDKKPRAHRLVVEFESIDAVLVLEAALSPLWCPGVASSASSVWGIYCAGRPRSLTIHPLLCAI